MAADSVSARVSSSLGRARAAVLAARADVAPALSPDNAWSGGAARAYRSDAAGVAQSMDEVAAAMGSLADASVATVTVGSSDGGALATSGGAVAGGLGTVAGLGIAGVLAAPFLTTTSSVGSAASASGSALAVAAANAADAAGSAGDIELQPVRPGPESHPLDDLSSAGSDTSGDGLPTDHAAGPSTEIEPSLDAAYESSSEPEYSWAGGSSDATSVDTDPAWNPNYVPEPGGVFELPEGGISVAYDIGGAPGLAAESDVGAWLEGADASLVPPAEVGPAPALADLAPSARPGLTAEVLDEINTSIVLAGTPPSLAAAELGLPGTSAAELNLINALVSASIRRYVPGLTLDGLQAINSAVRGGAPATLISQELGLPAISGSLLNQINRAVNAALVSIREMGVLGSAQYTEADGVTLGELAAIDSLNGGLGYDLDAILHSSELSWLPAADARAAIGEIQALLARSPSQLSLQQLAAIDAAISRGVSPGTAALQSGIDVSATDLAGLNGGVEEILDGLVHRLRPASELGIGTEPTLADLDAFLENRGVSSEHVSASTTTTDALLAALRAGVGAPTPLPSSSSVTFGQLTPDVLAYMNEIVADGSTSASRAGQVVGFRGMDAADLAAVNAVTRQALTDAGLPGSLTVENLSAINAAVRRGIPVENAGIVNGVDGLTQAQLDAANTAAQNSLNEAGISGLTSDVPPIASNQVTLGQISALDAMANAGTGDAQAFADAGFAGMTRGDLVAVESQVQATFAARGLPQMQIEQFAGIEAAVARGASIDSAAAQYGVPGLNRANLDLIRRDVGSVLHAAERDGLVGSYPAAGGNS